MTKSTRNRYSAEFKAKVALDAIRGELTVSQLVVKYGVHQTMINSWKKQAIDKLSTVFEQKSPSRWGCYHPHPSQNRTCRFLASGSSRESFARRGVLMDDPGGREWMSLEDFGEAVPWEPAPSIPSR